MVLPFPSGRGRRVSPLAVAPGEGLKSSPILNSHPALSQRERVTV